MDKYSLPRPERESYLKHRRDFQLKILLPIILASIAAVVIGVLAGMAASGSSTAVSLWADISLIWLIMPVMVMALVIAILMVALVYGMNRLLKVTPHYTGLVQGYALWLEAEVSIWTNKLTHPVVSIRTWLDLIMKRGA